MVMRPAAGRWPLSAGFRARAECTNAVVAVSGRPPAGAVCQSYSPPRVRCARPIMRGSVWAHEVLGHTNETLRRSGGGSRVARIPHSTKGLHVLVVTCQDWFLGVAIWGPLLQGLVVPLSLGFGGVGWADSLTIEYYCRAADQQAAEGGDPGFQVASRADATG